MVQVQIDVLDTNQFPEWLEELPGWRKKESGAYRALKCDGAPPHSKTWRMREAASKSRERLGLRVLLHRFLRLALAPGACHALHHAGT